MEAQLSPVSDALRALVDRWPNVALDVHQGPSGHIILSRIVIPADQRNEGTGTRILTELCVIADQHRSPIALTPTSDFGGTKSRLERWYRTFGFKPNKGPARDLTVREAMIRDPH